MRKCRRDSNEKGIVDALRKSGATVLFLDVKDGPDICVGKSGKNFLFEIKTATGKLSKGQTDWHSTWTGESLVIRSLEDALLYINQCSECKPSCAGCTTAIKKRAK